MVLPWDCQFKGFRASIVRIFPKLCFPIPKPVSMFIENGYILYVRVQNQSICIITLVEGFNFLRESIPFFLLVAKIIINQAFRIDKNAGCLIKNLDTEEASIHPLLWARWNIYQFHGLLCCDSESDHIVTTHIPFWNFF